MGSLMISLIYELSEELINSIFCKFLSFVIWIRDWYWTYQNLFLKFIYSKEMA